MRIEEAVQFLENGEQINRPCYDTNIALVRNLHGREEYYGIQKVNGNITRQHYFNRDDLLAEDWVVVKNPPKIWWHEDRLRLARDMNELRKEVGVAEVPILT